MLFVKIFVQLLTSVNRSLNPIGMDLLGLSDVRWQEQTDPCTQSSLELFVLGARFNHVVQNLRSVLNVSTKFGVVMQKRCGRFNRRHAGFFSKLNKHNAGIPLDKA